MVLVSPRFGLEIQSSLWQAVYLRKSSLIYLNLSLVISKMRKILPPFRFIVTLELINVKSLLNKYELHSWSSHMYRPDPGIMSSLKHCTLHWASSPLNRHFPTFQVGNLLSFRPQVSKVTSVMPPQPTHEKLFPPVDVTAILVQSFICHNWLQLIVYIGLSNQLEGITKTREHPIII